MLTVWQRGWRGIMAAGIIAAVAWLFMFGSLWLAVWLAGIVSGVSP